MNICLISQNATPGLTIFRKDFISYLVSEGHTVYAFAIDYSDDSKKNIESLGAIPMSYSLKKTGLNPFVDFLDIFKLFYQLKKIKPDVVFSFFVKPSIYGTLAAKFASVPRIIAMLEGRAFLRALASIKDKLLGLTNDFFL